MRITILKVKDKVNFAWKRSTPRVKLNRLKNRKYKENILH